MTTTLRFCLQSSWTGKSKTERNRSAAFRLDRAVCFYHSLRGDIETSEWIANYAALWTVATVLLEFHIAALAWRMRRELDMQAGGQPTWLTLN